MIACNPGNHVEVPSYNTVQVVGEERVLEDPEKTLGIDSVRKGGSVFFAGPEDRIGRRLIEHFFIIDFRKDVLTAADALQPLGKEGPRPWW